MADPILSNAQLYSTAVAANSDLKGIIWAKKVIKTTNEHFIFRHFVGQEGSKMPIVKKQELTAGAAQKVTFITVAPLRGKGTLGENTLETNTEKVLNGSFGVNVDYLAHGVAWTQSFAKIGPSGRNIDQWSSDALGGWWKRRQDDDPQIKLREAARLTYSATNLYRIGGRVSDATVSSSDTLTTTEIEAVKGILISHAADEVAMDINSDGVETPKFIFFGPDRFLRRLRSSTNYLAALQYAGVRGAGNEMFSGKYPLWDNNIMFVHNVACDDADGRQGSPLYPMAFLGTALTDGCSSQAVTGGGHLAAAVASGTGDYFANFPGYSWKIYDGESLPSDTGTYYLMIYNLTNGYYEVCSYTPTGVDATGAFITVTRGSATNFAGNVAAQAAGRFANVHPRGSIIIPCTVNGVPLSWAIHMGAQALFHAVGSVEVERLVKTGGFQNDKGEQRVVGYGIQGIRGMEPFVDVRNFPKNYMLVQGAGTYAGVSPVAY